MKQWALQDAKARLSKVGFLLDTNVVSDMVARNTIDVGLPELRVIDPWQTQAD